MPTVRTAWVPKAQVERVEPADLAGITLGMEKLATLSSPEDARAALIGLADQYETWIATQKRPAGNPALCESRRDLRDLASQRPGGRQADTPGHRGLIGSQGLPRSRWPTRRWPARLGAAIAFKRASGPSRWMSRPGGRFSLRSFY